MDLEKLASTQRKSNLQLYHKFITGFIEYHIPLCAYRSQITSLLFCGSVHISDPAYTTSGHGPHYMVFAELNKPQRAGQCLQSSILWAIRPQIGPQALL